MQNWVWAIGAGVVVSNFICRIIYMLDSGLEAHGRPWQSRVGSRERGNDRRGGHCGQNCRLAHAYLPDVCCEKPSCNALKICAD
jgi:hypothetical protein